MSKFHATPYYHGYIELVQESDIVTALKNRLITIRDLSESLEEAQGQFRYEEGKWSVNELLVHLVDTERVMSYRALRFARMDNTPLPGFEQDDYARTGSADQRELSNILLEYEAVRQATIAQFLSYNEETLTRFGVASEAEVSVSALGHIIAGHQDHHLNVLRERYQLKF